MHNKINRHATLSGAKRRSPSAKSRGEDADLDETDDDSMTREPETDDALEPCVVETSSERRLHFASYASQSRMCFYNPNALLDEYTRKMMAFLLFVPEPQHIVIIGLGGGSLAKFCYFHLPNTRITAVEISPAVVALRNAFCVPADDERFSVICDDGARYLAASRTIADVMLVDAFDAEGVALSLLETDFFHYAARQLSANGTLVMNLCGEQWRCDQIVAKARNEFSGRVRLVPVANSGNDLLFAFKSDMPELINDTIIQHAAQLHLRFNLNFPRYLERISNSAVLS